MFRAAARLLALPLLLAVLTPLHADAAQRHAQKRTIALQSGHSTILSVKDVNYVAIGDPTIVAVVPVGPRQLVVNAKAPGRTSLTVWSHGVPRSWEISVQAESLNDLAGAIQTTLAEPDVTVADLGGVLVARGTVEDTTRFVRVSDILARFQPALGEKRTIVNAVTVRHPFGALQAQLDALAGPGAVRVDADAKGNVIVSGRAHTRVTAEAVLAKVRGLAGPYLGTDGKVVDRLAVDDSTEIDVKCYVLEIDDTGLSNLGIQLQSGTPDPNNPSNITLGQPSFPLIEGAAASTLGKALTLGAFFRTTRLAPTINLLLQSGHAKVLSAPNLVTTPGNDATFLVGGQIPYVFSTGQGAVSVQFKDYGVKLDVTPTILGTGGIETKIAPEVSDLDYSDSVTFGGYTIPAIKTSKLSTDVVTQPGESIVMGGLLRHVEQKTIQKIPGLSAIPILGKLFQSTSYQNNSTDVVFVMTPEVLVK
ncbi:MAG TPA: pilus assembly protein N-terminal domain-containing protein [Candidatus Baltobacteraceae bacterium]|nr:pilus assembly protein N-terminal domain-containing protein [Candidatus Baltobacteraceae bacterium]